jgi:hypothetical protein
MSSSLKLRDTLASIIPAPGKLSLDLVERRPKPKIPRFFFFSFLTGSKSSRKVSPKGRLHFGSELFLFGMVFREIFGEGFREVIPSSRAAFKGLGSNPIGEEGVMFLLIGEGFREVIPSSRAAFGEEGTMFVPAVRLIGLIGGPALYRGFDNFGSVVASKRESICGADDLVGTFGAIGIVGNFCTN